MTLLPLGSNLRNDKKNAKRVGVGGLVNGLVVYLHLPEAPSPSYTHENIHAQVPHREKSS